MSRVNEIFSVNKLRESWAQQDIPEEASHETSSAHPQNEKVLAECGRLAVILKNRYSESQMPPFDILLEHLKEDLKLLFPETGDRESKEGESETTPEERDPVELKNEIIGFLNTIEDIAEGFDCCMVTAPKD